MKQNLRIATIAMLVLLPFLFLFKIGVISIQDARANPGRKYGALPIIITSRNDPQSIRIELIEQLNKGAAEGWKYTDTVSVLGGPNMAYLFLIFEKEEKE